MLAVPEPLETGSDGAAHPRYVCDVGPAGARGRAFSLPSGGGAQRLWSQRPFTFVTPVNAYY